MNHIKLIKSHTGMRPAWAIKNSAGGTHISMGNMSNGKWNFIRTRIPFYWFEVVKPILECWKRRSAWVSLRNNIHSTLCASETVDVYIHHYLAICIENWTKQLLLGKHDLRMCELSLTQTGLTSRKGAEIFPNAFDEVWLKCGGAQLTSAK